ncbi:glucose-6-phosphate isomerase [bacterium]|nr:glucose-6-phosphate isomerase [bacterium]
MLDLIKKRTPDIRRLESMRELLYDREWAERAGDIDLYYMYRDVARQEDTEKIQGADLRYDITIIPPNMLGEEYTKTIGHYHPMAVDSAISYPEVYEVLEGEAIYFMQKEDLSDAYFVRASVQDKVIISPNYGHITINPSNKPLKMANWVCASFSSLYGAYKEKKGGAYYRTLSGWVKNTEYSPLPEIRELSPTNFEDIGFKKGVPMYSLVSDIEKLEFLKFPKAFSALWERIVSGQQ